jgi:ribosome-binding protein aMBF1 (putative translation factor)
MPKYSTEGSTTDTSGEATACELCGNDSSSLQEASVAGAQLRVCDECTPHNDSQDETNNSDDTETGDTDTDRTRDVIQKTTDESGYLNRDSSHWEKEGTNYTDDPLPYLITD